MRKGFNMFKRKRRPPVPVERVKRPPIRRGYAVGGSVTAPYGASASNSATSGPPPINPVSLSAALDRRAQSSTPHPEDAPLLATRPAGAPEVPQEYARGGPVQKRRYPVVPSRPGDFGEDGAVRQMRRMTKAPRVGYGMPRYAHGGAVRRYQDGGEVEFYDDLEPGGYTLRGGPDEFPPDEREPPIERDPEIEFEPEGPDIDPGGEPDSDFDDNTDFGSPDPEAPEEPYHPGSAPPAAGGGEGAGTGAGGAPQTGYSPEASARPQGGGQETVMAALGDPIQSMRSGLEWVRNALGVGSANAAEAPRPPSDQVPPGTPRPELPPEMASTATNQPLPPQPQMADTVEPDERPQPPVIRTGYNPQEQVTPQRAVQQVPQQRMAQAAPRTPPPPITRDTQDPNAPTPAPDAALRDYIAGKGGFSPEQMTKLLDSARAANPGMNPKSDITTAFTRLQSDAERGQFLQALRPSYEKMRAVMLAAIEKKDYVSALRLATQMNDLIPNGRDVQFVDQSGHITAIIRDPKNGKQTTLALTPQQFIDGYAKSANSLFDAATAAPPEKILTTVGGKPIGPQGAPAAPRTTQDDELQQRQNAFKYGTGQPQTGYQQRQQELAQQQEQQRRMQPYIRPQLPGEQQQQGQPQPQKSPARIQYERELAEWQRGEAEAQARYRAWQMFPYSNQRTQRARAEMQMLNNIQRADAARQAQEARERNIQFQANERRQNIYRQGDVRYQTNEQQNEARRRLEDTRQQEMNRRTEYQQQQMNARADRQLQGLNDRAILTQLGNNERRAMDHLLARYRAWAASDAGKVEGAKFPYTAEDYEFLNNMSRRVREGNDTYDRFMRISPEERQRRNELQRQQSTPQPAPPPEIKHDSPPPPGAPKDGKWHTDPSGIPVWQGSDKSLWSRDGKQLRAGPGQPDLRGQPRAPERLPPASAPPSGVWETGP